MRGECAGRFALEAGFRRCASRVGVPSTRASWFVGDVPEFMASPKWYLFAVFCSSRVRKSHRAQSYRFAGRPPRPEALRGSLYNEGFVYQYASRASALVFFFGVCVAQTDGELRESRGDDGCHHSCNRGV